MLNTTTGHIIEVVAHKEGRKVAGFSVLASRYADTEYPPTNAGDPPVVIRVRSFYHDSLGYFDSETVGVKAARAQANALAQACVVSYPVCTLKLA